LGGWFPHLPDTPQPLRYIAPGAEGPGGMKRTPLWVFVAAVGIQIAALGLCIWAMEDFGHLEDDADGKPEEKPAPLGVLNPAPVVVPADVAFARQPVPEPAPPASPCLPTGHRSKASPKTSPQRGHDSARQEEEPLLQARKMKPQMNADERR